jgi:hypothetical protein
MLQSMLPRRFRPIVFKTMVELLGGERDRARDRNQKQSVRHRLVS